MFKLPIWNERKTFRLRPSIGQHILKIVLKTKNDPFFIERWIEHHAAIVGYSNIIILDNGSDDEDVLVVYQRYADRVEIIRFDGFHNDVHDVRKFPGLYAALADSSFYYLVIDTDEFLYYFDGESFCGDEGIVGRLARLGFGQSVPTTWMYNAAGYNRRAVCGVQADTLGNGLRWGKPIIRSAAALTGYINHNCQLPVHELARFGASRGFFLMHLAQLSPRQRVRANKTKLVARGFADPRDTMEMILGRDAAGSDGNILMYLSEIQRLLPKEEVIHPESNPLEPGSLRIGDDGVVEFASGLEETLFRRFFDDFPAVCARTLAQGEARLFAS